MSETAPAPEPLFPPLVLAVYITCIAGAGALANCAVLAALLKRAKHGLFFIIIQLAAADLILLGTTIGPELWFCNSRTWHFGRGGCIAYRGLSVFASTASLYLVITIALHTLATINLEEKETIRRNKSKVQDDDEELRSSRHSLVANSDSSTPPRTMNVDYRLTDTRVPVAPPTAFIWILSISLSVPEFVLTTTLPLENTTTCTLVDSSHRLNMQSLLAIFNLILPSIILTVAAVPIMIKLRRRSGADSFESVAALKLSLCMIIAYGVLCAPRSVLAIYRVHSTSYNDNATVFGLLEENNTLLMVSFVFSCAYLLSTLVRPILCILLLPRIRNILSFGSKNKNRNNV